MSKSVTDATLDSIVISAASDTLSSNDPQAYKSFIVKLSALVYPIPTDSQANEIFDIVCPIRLFLDSGEEVAKIPWGRIENGEFKYRVTVLEPRVQEALGPMIRVFLYIEALKYFHTEVLRDKMREHGRLPDETLH